MFIYIDISIHLVHPTHVKEYNNTCVTAISQTSNIYFQNRPTVHVGPLIFLQGIQFVKSSVGGYTTVTDRSPEGASRRPFRLITLHMDVHNPPHTL